MLHLIAKDERWKPIAEFPEYEISDRGRIRDISSGVELNITSDKDGAETVRFPVLPKAKYRRLGKLVLLAFVGPKPSGHFVFWKDGDRMNSAVENLAWKTPKEIEKLTGEKLFRPKKPKWREPQEPLSVCKESMEKIIVWLNHGVPIHTVAEYFKYRDPAAHRALAVERWFGEG